MPENDSLKPSSVLFWLSALIAAGIIVVGLRFLLVPLAAARDFGVPVPGNSTFAYLWTKGTRDIVSGLLLISLPWLGVRRAVLATFLFVAAMIPIADFLNVYINVHSERPGYLIMHGGTAIFMIVLASVILHTPKFVADRQVTVQQTRRSA